MNTPKNYYSWLDWIRFSAAFTVLLCHTREQTWVPWRFMPLEDKNPFSLFIFSISHFGQESVIIFFVLSGLLVGGKLIERVVNGTFSLSDYAVDRITRVYVPYIPALIFSGLVANSLKRSNPDALSFLGNILGLQGIFVNSFCSNDALWTLAYEIWFYVLGGAIALLVSRNSNKLAALVVMILGFIIFVKLKFIYLVCWFIGAVAWRIKSSAGGCKTMLWGIFFLIAGIFLNFRSPVIGDNSLSIEDANSIRSSSVAIIILSAGAALLVLNLSLKNPKGIVLSIDSLGRRFASGSYTLYLTHYPVLMVWKTVQSTPVAVFNKYYLGLFLIKILSCLIVSWLMYHAFERHTPDVRKWIKSKGIFNFKICT